MPGHSGQFAIALQAYSVYATETSQYSSASSFPQSVQTAALQPCIRQSRPPRSLVSSVLSADVPRRTLVPVRTREVSSSAVPACTTCSSVHRGTICQTGDTRQERHSTRAFVLCCEWTGRCPRSECSPCEAPAVLRRSPSARECSGCFSATAETLDTTEQTSHRFSCYNFEDLQDIHPTKPILRILHIPIYFHKMFKPPLFPQNSRSIYVSFI